MTKVIQGPAKLWMPRPPPPPVSDISFSSSRPWPCHSGQSGLRSVPQPGRYCSHQASALLFHWPRVLPPQASAGWTPSLPSNLHSDFTFPSVLSRFSRVQLFATPQTVAHQAPLSTGFFRREHWRGCHVLPPGHVPNPGSNPRLLQVLH